MVRQYRFINILAKKTDDFNGADLEGIVKGAVEPAFIDREKSVTSEFLLKSLEDAKSISNIQGDKITKLREELKRYDIKPASLRLLKDLIKRNR